MFQSKRSYDAKGLQKAMKRFSQDWEGFDTEALVGNSANILLSDGADNFALFEYRDRGVVEGHYLYGSARGKDAVVLSRDFLRHLFHRYPEIKLVIGKTPEDKKGALFLNKKLGFQEIGKETINGEVFHLVCLSRERYNKQ